MPYKLQFFKDQGIYLEKPEREELDLRGGLIIPASSLPDKVNFMLDNPGGKSHGGDISKQDFSVMLRMLQAGLNPADIIMTFAKSSRGRDAEIRKEGHFEDYLERTIEKAKSYTKNTVTVDFGQEDKAVGPAGINIRKASDVEVDKVSWIWPKYIPQGKLTILAGDPGQGKSQISLDIAARISRGDIMPCGARGISGTCAIMSAEDAANDTMVPRLIAAGANRERIYFMDTTTDDEGKERIIQFPKDFDFLKTQLQSIKPKILIIDPINSFLQGNIDSHRDQDIRAVLHPFEKIAQSTNTALLLIMHKNKRSEGTAINKVGGSIGYVAAARSVLGVGVSDNNTKVFFPIKYNLTKKPPSIAYDVVSTKYDRRSGKVDWKGEEDTIESSKISWLGPIEYDPNSTVSAGSNDIEVIAAKKYLRMVFEESREIESQVLFTMARQAAISKPALIQARKDLPIESIPKKGKVYWVMQDSQIESDKS